MRTLLCAAATLLLAAGATAQPVDSVITQKESPIYIRSLDTEANDRASHVAFHIMYRNRMREEVKAIRVVVLSVGPFGDVLGFSQWTEVDDLQPYYEVGEHETLDLNLPTLKTHMHYFGIVYVDRVLMGDGREWAANMDSVRTKIEKAVGRPGFTLPDDTTAVERGASI